MFFCEGRLSLVVKNEKEEVRLVLCAEEHRACCHRPALRDGARGGVLEADRLEQLGGRVSQPLALVPLTESASPINHTDHTHY